MIYILVLIF